MYCFAECSKLMAIQEEKIFYLKIVPGVIYLRKNENESYFIDLERK